MNPPHHSVRQVSLESCPPKEFAGRFEERKEFREIVGRARQRGQLVLISGVRGAGKTSFLDWGKYEIQNRSGGVKSPAIKREFLGTPGMVFTTYKDLLEDLGAHQQFPWFKRILGSSRVQRSIKAALGVLEKASPLTGPGAVGVEFGTAMAREFLPSEARQYPQLVSSLLSVLRNLSSELIGIENDYVLAILLDDVQFSSEPDFQLLKDLARHIPPAIALVVTFLLEAKSTEMYGGLQREMDRFGYCEIRLGGMAAKEIGDFASLRYALSIDKVAAEFLEKHISDPLALVGCFNLLQNRGLSPSAPNIQRVLPEVVDSARCIYSGLDASEKTWLNSLCILHPPLPLALVNCMLKKEEHDIVDLKDKLDQSIVFRRRGRELYDFAHAALREYRRKELPESESVALHARAAECLEGLRDRLRDKLPERLVDLSLAEHLFYGQKYEKALEPNLRLGDLFYDLFLYPQALQLTERAQTCAEKAEKRRMLAVALHQKGMILQRLFGFNDSLSSYKKSLDIEQEIGDRSGEATTLHQMGMVYEDTNRFDEALKYYKKSLDIEQEIGDRSSEATSLRTIKALKQKMLRDKGK